METGKRDTAEGLTVLQRGPAGEILRLLQRHGPMSTKQLRAALGVSSLNAVREQLAHLNAGGLIETTTVRQGAGRPSFLYALSDKAQALFPKGYDILLKLLLEEIVAQQGRAALDSLLSGVSGRLATEYGGSGDGAALEERLQVLSAAFEARGTPISIVERDDAVTVHEYSCPYFNVAQEDTNVCAIEQQMLEQVLGRKVQLTQRMVDGHAGCQFVVQPTATSDQPTETGHTQGRERQRQNRSINEADAHNF